MSITARPIRAPETGIGQPRECTEHDQIKREKKCDPCKFAVFVTIARYPYDCQGQQRHQHAHGSQLDQHDGHPESGS